MHSCVSNHGFIDANKRTAWILTEMLIERSGYHLAVPDDEPIDDLVVSVASGGTDFKDLENWFALRIAKSSG